MGLWAPSQAQTAPFRTVPLGLELSISLNHHPGAGPVPQSSGKQQIRRLFPPAPSQIFPPSSSGGRLSPGSHRERSPTDD